jgi:hypothetical protein
MQAGPRKKLPTDIIEMTCELSTDKAWADLQRAGMSTAVLLKQYYAQKVNDRPLGLHIIKLKQAEHAGWLALVSPEYAGAAKCSLMIEQLAYELGDSAAQMAVLCAISDREIELSATEHKPQLLHHCNNNRWVRQLPLCCNVACGIPLTQPRPPCCAQCKVAVYCNKTCQTQAWKAGHRRECVPAAQPPVPASPAPERPQYVYEGHVRVPASPVMHDCLRQVRKHDCLRHTYDTLKAQDRNSQSASMVAMFASLSCAERMPSVFEVPSEYLELEQVRCLSYISSHTHTHTHTHQYFLIPLIKRHFPSHYIPLIKRIFSPLLSTIHTHYIPLIKRHFFRHP